MDTNHDTIAALTEVIRELRAELQAQRERIAALEAERWQPAMRPIHYKGTTGEPPEHPLGPTIICDTPTVIGDPVVERGATTIFDKQVETQWTPTAPATCCELLPDAVLDPP